MGSPRVVETEAYDGPGGTTIRARLPFTAAISARCCWMRSLILFCGTLIGGTTAAVGADLGRLMRINLDWVMLVLVYLWLMCGLAVPAALDAVIREH